MSTNPLTIVQLTASNVKRLRAVTIKPDGSAVVLGGKNGAGKSSVLDSIEMALAGEGSVPKVPVRRGEERAEIVVDLGEIVVRRTFTAAGGTSLVVTNKEGARFPSPQAMLDNLTGRLTFDPLAFSRMKPAEQHETLRRLVGLDFSALDSERASAFATRTDVSRDGRAMASRFDAMPSHPDAPAAEVSSSSILAEQDAATRAHAAEVEKCRAVNDGNARVRSSASAARVAQDAARAAVEAANRAEDEAQAEVDRWTKIRKERSAAASAAREALESATTRADKATKEAGALLDVGCVAPDLAPYRTRLAAVETTNAKVRANKARADAEKALEAKRVESKRLSDRLAAIDAEKAALIAAARLPVDGLGFADGGVTLDGLPFEQASQAQQLRVSVAMGFAMNPRLKILLIRDASLLDTDSLRMVEEMAESAGAQVWMERVEQDAATTVLIEDGTAVAVEREVAS